MSSHTGANPPLHRRCDERTAIRHIRRRYRVSREKIARQVEALQKDPEFLAKCRDYYRKGYKDWVILYGIVNCMLNWKARELGLLLHIEENRGQYREQFPQLLDGLSGTVYSTNRFLGEDMDMHMRLHCCNVLTTYGFEIRRRDFRPEVVENFMRVRMRHFEFDLPHDPLFGEPPGYWPRA